MRLHAYILGLGYLYSLWLGFPKIIIIIIIIIIVVVGALGVVSKRLDAWLEKLGVTIRMGLLQKTALLGTARILRKVLDS